MDRRVLGLTVLVAAIIATSGVFILYNIPSQIDPDISVEGGFIKSSETGSSIIWATAPNINVTLNWDTSDFGTAIYRIYVENVYPERVTVSSTAQYTEVDMGSVSKAVDISTTVPTVSISFFTQNSDDSLEFYVLGDSQGYQDGINQMAVDANENLPDFVFHCGDLTPFGQENQYEAVFTALNTLTVPFYATIGNHDIRLGGSDRYTQYFGSSTYSFDFGGTHFAVYNSSSGDVTEEEIQWLESDLSTSDMDWKFVFTHIPLFDPRSGSEHTMQNTTTALRLENIFETTGVDVVFAGHIHMFNHTVVNGVEYVITGGAGASLYAPPEDGGIHHYIKVTVVGSNLTISPVQLNSPSIQRDQLVIRGLFEDVTLTIDDLLSLPYIEGFSSFQNAYGNWRGQGTYRGVRMSDLLTLVSGMSSDDTLMVQAYDGYEQVFSYSNIYPNGSWSDIQGDMILAYMYNGTSVPQWDDGFRLVFIPPDGAYSNEDCELTSAPGMGYHVYPSAGARWVSAVNLIEVVPN